LQVLVRDNNIDQALRVLKKKMQREGVFREMKQRNSYEKPSERKNREKSEAIRRARKLARKKAQREGLIPDIKLGTGARLKFYGIFKTSVIHDSSSPQGNDFPLPLLAQDTGPNNSPEFHVRARGLRLEEGATA